MKSAPTDYGATTGYRRHKTQDSMGSVDYCEDLNEVMEIRRTKVELNVADLSVHSNDYKYRLYQWNLIPIAIFYALPVIQLVAGVYLSKPLLLEFLSCFKLIATTLMYCLVFTIMFYVSYKT